MTTPLLDSADATEALGARLARAMLTETRIVIYLRGELGAGKTTLVRGFMRALGHRGAVKSPTFTLVEPYEIGNRRIYHCDLYRITDPMELEYLGVRDFGAEDCIFIVEWPERGTGGLPASDLEIDLKYADNGRKYAIVPLSSLGAAIINKINTE